MYMYGSGTDCSLQEFMGASMPRFYLAAAEKNRGFFSMAARQSLDVEGLGTRLACYTAPVKQLVY